MDEQIIDDQISNNSANSTFEDILNVRMSRRTLAIGGLAGAALAFVGTSGIASASAPRTKYEALSTARRPSGRPTIGFTSIPLQDGPMPTIAPEYRYDVLIPWREKLDGSGTSFAYDGFTAAQQEQSIGIGHDGMHFFGDNKSGTLCINHEYGTSQHVFGAAAPTSLAQVRLSQAAHGVSVVSLKRKRNGWKLEPSPLNRRITVNTRVAFSGPAADSPLLENAAGNPARGTLNNCANGYTPWGTYLTCEENFNGYFGAREAWTASPEQSRYGISSSGFGYAWHQFDDRFDLSNSEYANEANRFGWVVEIDPRRPKSRPVKRTALGRIKHEGAEVVVGKDNRVVVYMGDDERFEYIYKFVSKGDWQRMVKRGVSPLDEGTLYVARFHEDGTGQWLKLDPSNPKLRSWTIDEILVNTRAAADVVGATKMDRPEWISVGRNQEVFCTLTNNSRRGVDTNPGTDAANPVANNTWGHIIRWRDASRHTGLTFDWDIFALAQDVSDDAGQMFGSPDGIWADKQGRVFVQTDGSQPGGMNDQMLVADQRSGEFKRIFTGVKGCEVTGVAVTPDQRTMFVNLQHPGDGDPATSNFPEPFTGAAGPVPRDCTIVITRRDGGVIGS